MADFFQRLLALLRPSTKKRVVEQMIRSSEAEEKRTADLESQERIREKVAKEDAQKRAGSRWKSEELFAGIFGKFASHSCVWK